MKLDSKLQMSLSKRSGNVVLRRELSDLGSPSHLSQALKHLVEAGRLVKLSTGVYAKAFPDATGKAHPLAMPANLSKEAFQKLGIQVHSVKMAQEAGRPVLLVDAGDSRVSRKFDFAGIAMRYIGRADGRVRAATVPSDPDALPTRDVRLYVERLARLHGIRYTRTGLDNYAEAVTRAAGDEVKLDITGKLLVALKKKELINGRQLARLMTNYMREVKDVRSVRRPRQRGLSTQR